MLLKTYGVGLVAEWCGVAEDTVYQWLRRGTDAEPVPSGRVPAILAGARRADLAAPLSVLWPAMDEQVRAAPAADEDWASRDFLSVGEAV